MKLVHVHEFLRMRSALFAKTLQQLNVFEITFTNNVCIFVIEYFVLEMFLFQTIDQGEGREGLCAPEGKCFFLDSRRQCPLLSGRSRKSLKSLLLQSAPPTHLHVPSSKTALLDALQSYLRL